jgi:hypothetical protein
MQTIPCILHMEMRVGLKIFTMILIKGLAEAKAGRLFHDQTSEGKRIKLFIAEVERIMNEEILGEVSDKSSWMFPYDEKLKKVGTVSLDNTKVRKLVAKMDQIINTCVTDADRQL